MDKMIDRLDELSCSINLQIIKNNQKHNQKENLTENEKDLLEEITDQLIEFKIKLDEIIYPGDVNSSSDEEESVKEETENGYLEESEIDSDLE